MSGLGWAVTALGLAIIVTRGPLIFAPEATLDVYRRLLGTTTRIRGLGVAIAGIGLAFVASAEGTDSLAASLVNALGLIMAAAAILLFIALPNVVQAFAESILDAISDVARPIGVLAVALGLGFVWLGVAVL